MPAAWTDGHHIKHWADGGSHDLWNLMLFCRRHHGFFHEGGWTLQQAEGGLLAIPP
jgi:predicted restriction endonuclease